MSREDILKTCCHCTAVYEYPENYSENTKCTNCEKLMFVKCPLCNMLNDYDETVCVSCRKPLGRKFDEGKTDWTLAPWEAFDAIIKVMMFGAKKYARGNWKHVEPPHRYIAAAYRHLNAWCEGEASDKETGFSHLWHVGCCIIFSIWLESRGKLKAGELDNG